MYSVASFPSVFLVGSFSSSLQQSVHSTLFVVNTKSILYLIFLDYTLRYFTRGTKSSKTDIYINVVWQTHEDSIFSMRYSIISNVKRNPFFRQYLPRGSDFASFRLSCSNWSRIKAAPSKIRTRVAESRRKLVHARVSMRVYERFQNNASEGLNVPYFRSCLTRGFILYNCLHSENG